MGVAVWRIASVAEAFFGVSDAILLTAGWVVRRLGIPEGKSLIFRLVDVLVNFACCGTHRFGVFGLLFS